MDWKNANEGPVWVPVINETERMLKLPADLLARIAFEESSFKRGVIEGTEASRVGALGILQLMPEFFPAVKAPIPFSNLSVREQIVRAGQYLAYLYLRFNSWDEALAAYNFGPGNEEKFLSHRVAALPKETQNYVAQILADVPLQTPTSTGSVA